MALASAALRDFTPPSAHSFTHLCRTIIFAVRCSAKPSHLLLAQSIALRCQRQFFTQLKQVNKLGYELSTEVEWWKLTLRKQGSIKLERIEWPLLQNMINVTFLGASATELPSIDYTECYY